MARWQAGRVAFAVVVGIISFFLGYGLRELIARSDNSGELLSGLPLAAPAPSPNPYTPYRFSNLATTTFTSQPLTLLDTLATEPSFTSYLVSWQVPDFSTGKSQRVTGQMNVPASAGPFPIIVMVRGYVEREQYTTGVGTKNAAAALARSGFITIAPDFLGYGGSESESTDILLSRFQRPVTVLQLLKNLENLRFVPPVVTPSPPPSPALENQSAPAPPTLPSPRLFDPNRIGLWGHSNGGQIALSVLEITGRRFPTTLWAPVSKPFPYSILYYTDELDDQGEYIRKQLANFEGHAENAIEDFTILHQPERILGPIQIHQGGADEAVPLRWSTQLRDLLKEKKVLVTLFTYPGSNHNLQPDWNTVVQRDLQFFAEELKEN